MLRSGDEHLERLRDGRVVYVGSERIDDVTTHPAFARGARTVAALYDTKRDPANHDRFTFVEDGERHSAWFLRARNADDLRLRSACHRAVADLTYGFLGRSPDHVAGFVAGMSTAPEVFDRGGQGFGDNLLRYYEHCRDNDLYATYAVVPPQAARNPDFYVKQNLPIPTLRVVGERDDGVVISGMKMLATSAVYADEIWIGNLIPLAPDQSAQAVTCAVPVNAPGLSLWSRRPLEPTAASEFDHPLSWRFDESDAMVMCQDVFVPWDRVFVIGDPLQARQIYIDTPAHCYGNHQSNVRFASKLALILGVCARVAEVSGAIDVPAVRETLGVLAGQEALLNGVIAGQIEAAESWPDGYLTFNRRMMYAALDWCTSNYSPIIDQLRELAGGGVYQMPSDVSVTVGDDTAELFAEYWQTPDVSALERMKLLRLVWELVGSEFAGRQQQYEKFYAGASFIVRNHSYRETPWDDFAGTVDGFLDRYDAPES